MCTTSTRAAARSCSSCPAHPTGRSPTAAGLSLPRWTGLLPWLTPLAAAGLLPILLGAAVLHLRRSAYLQALGDALVLAFVAAVGYLTL